MQGDCRSVLKTLPDASVHCVVTSPPYWGLRDYGVDGQIGLEQSVHTWVEEMVAVFREVRRVLRDDGTLWLNLGDSYCSAPPGTKRPGASESSTLHGVNSERYRGTLDASQGQKRDTSRVPGLKPKDLIGQPWRVAFALQADGWWLRQDIVWAKANPMPESVRDRCTKAHEYVFLLAKSERYYYDFEAMQEPVSGGAHARLPGNKTHKHTAEYDATGDARHRTKAGLVAYAERMHNSAAARNARANPDAKNAPGEMVNGMRTVGVGHNKRPRKAVPNVGRRQGPPGNAAEALALQGPKAQLDANDSAYGAGKSARMGRGAGWRNKHNESFDEAMAVMPATRNKRSVWHVATAPFAEAHFATFPPALIEPCILAGCPEGGVVLDPFFGAGTTGLVADRLQRDCIGIELNPAYIDIARRRIAGDAPLFAEVAHA